MNTVSSFLTPAPRPHNLRVLIRSPLLHASPCANRRRSHSQYRHALLDSFLTRQFVKRWSRSRILASYRGLLQIGTFLEIPANLGSSQQLLRRPPTSSVSFTALARLDKTKLAQPYILVTQIDTTSFPVIESVGKAIRICYDTSNINQRNCNLFNSLHSVASPKSRRTCPVPLLMMVPPSV